MFKNELKTKQKTIENIRYEYIKGSAERDMEVGISMGGGGASQTNTNIGIF
jgi:hypothetical protein